MAYAINRDEYSQVFNLGLTELRNAAPPSDWSFYEDSQGRLYVEYDVDLANELLDELGLAWDANQEWRLRPDNGEQFIITTEIGQEGHRPGEWEFITRYWAEVGIDRVKALCFGDCLRIDANGAKIVNKPLIFFVCSLCALGFLICALGF